MENSAIAPDLQVLAGRWLQPDITVLTNILPDHQEVWGPTANCAAEVLTAGIPKGGQVMVPADLETDDYLLALLERRRCQVIFCKPAVVAGAHFHAINLGLARTVVEHLGLPTVAAFQAMLRLQPDSYDFNVVSCGGAEVAMAFSANDISSTRNLFRSLSWSEQDTRLIYNHRTDRPGRFKSFVEWLSNSPWREVLIIGDKPQTRLGCARYVPLKNIEGLLRLFQPGDQIFGCGNIAGLPLSLVAAVNC